MFISYLRSNVSLCVKMAEDVVLKVNELLTPADVSSICGALKKNTVRVLTFRECEIHSTDLHRILKFAASSSVLQKLTLNVGIITVLRHVELLSACIAKNKFITHLQ